MSPRSATIRSGSGRPGCFTKKAPPFSGSFNNGVHAIADPASALRHLPAWYSLSVHALLHHIQERADRRGLDRNG